MEKEEKKLKSRKSVNWDLKENEEKDKNTNEKDKEDNKINENNKNEYLEIEVINKEGNITKERVKYEHKSSKEFFQKRESLSHDEYTKAKEFLEHHKTDEEI